MLRTKSAAETQITSTCAWSSRNLRLPGPSPSPSQGYQWLKDKILSEEGRRQQAKLKELQAIAERLGCTLPQLAIGNGLWVQWWDTRP